MTEPDFVFQNFDPMTPEERRQWFADRLKEQWERGAVLSRASVGENGTPYEGGCLVEGWIEYTEEQGEPRWLMTA